MRILSLSPDLSEWLALLDIKPAGALPDIGEEQVPGSRSLVYYTDPEKAGYGSDGYDLILKEDRRYPINDAYPSGEASPAGTGTELILDGVSFKQVLDTALNLGYRMGRSKEMMAFIARSERRLDTLRKEAGLNRRLEPSQNVLWIDRINPLRTAGLWIPDLIDLAGGKNLGPIRGVLPEQIHDFGGAARTADLVVVSLPGYSVSAVHRLLYEGELRRTHDNTRLVILDGTRHFYYRTPLLYRSVELIMAAMYPDLVRSSHLQPKPDELVVFAE